MSGLLKIVFYRPGDDTKFYLYRDSEITPDVLQARHFNNADSCVAFRDRFRESYPKCTIFIEDAQGNRLYERDVQPPSPMEDNRSACFVEPTGFEHSGLGFLVRPAIRPGEGFCWCIRAADVPSMSDRALVTETIYGSDPINMVERMLATWGLLATPSPAPWAAQQDAAQAKTILKQFHELRSPGRMRPGNQSGE
jgi:hypothetical protein